MEVLLSISLSNDQQGWVALLVAMCAIGYLLFRKKVKRDPLDKPAFSSLSQQRGVERQMQNLLVELSEMTRQMNAQIDTRAAKLEQLISQADERLAALKNLERVAANDPAPSTILTSPVAEISRQESDPMEQPPEKVEAAAQCSEVDPRHAEIYSLADRGQGIREIASRMNQPTGEVELILALRPRA